MRSSSSIEFLNGRPLSAEELDAIRQHFERMDSVEAVHPEIRGIVARNWPHLLSKLPPDPDAEVGPRSSSTGCKFLL